MKKSWYTCTPVRFNGDHTFFARDSGLLCKGFQELGIECKAIMPGPPMDTDQSADLIRTDYANLEDPAWWRSLDADGVVLYAWGAGRYREIASAIRDAGIILVSNVDASGILGIFSGIFNFIGATIRITRQRHQSKLKYLLDCILRILYGFIIAPLKNDLTRAMHLRNSNLIGCVTPKATKSIRKACRWYGGKKLEEIVCTIPHPVAPYMQYNSSIKKQNLVVSIGRWDDLVQKDPMLLAKTVDLVCNKDLSIEFAIVGSMLPNTRNKFTELNQKYGDRIKILGILPNAELRHILMKAKILLCTSSYESFHIASGEALCCGVSIVGPLLPEIPSMEWFAREPHGHGSKRDGMSLAQAIADEIKAWDEGRRNPNDIAHYWTRKLHAPRVAEHILALAKAVEH